MSECCGPAQSCCGGGSAAPYEYGPTPYVTGSMDTFAGAVPLVESGLTQADRRGGFRVRLGIGRSDYRVPPGLYAVGAPDDTAPVLVTANYKLTFDALRGELTGRDAWILVLDTRGVNVWCAAGKRTFSTGEVVRRIRDARLEQIVSHTRLVLPQLGATGVAAHEVRAATGFTVVWGPVRASDLPEFLDAGFKATPDMRRVEFPLRERAKLVGVELSVLWRRHTLLAAAGAAVALGLAALFAPQAVAPLAIAAVSAVVSVIAGAVVAPILLPWLPGRTFSLKGAVAAALLLLALMIVLLGGVDLPVYAWGLVAAGTALASFVMMNFTGSSTFTSPSGVEWEMRRALPVQVTGAAAGIVAFVWGVVVL